MEDSGHMTRTMLPPFGEEGCLANQNGEFQSHDEKKQEDDAMFCHATQC